MPKARSPNRDKALEIYLKNSGNISNRKIAEILNISEKTVSGWKFKDSWEEKINGVLQSKERSTPKKAEGGQPGNQNAKGHGAPPRNQNALTHGGYAKIYRDDMQDGEESILEELEQMSTDNTLEMQIQDMILHIRRLKKRRQSFELNSEMADSNDKKTVYACITQADDQIALAQGRLTKAIEALNKLRNDKRRIELEQDKLTLYRAKVTGQIEIDLDD